MSSFDTSITNQAFLKFNMENGLLSSGDYANANALLANSLSGVYGSTTTQTAALQKTLLKNIETYLVETNQYIVLNDLANNNDYVAQTLNDEIEQSSHVRDKTLNTVYKTQQSYFQKKYAISYNYFVAAIIKFLILAALVIVSVTTLFKLGKISQIWFAAIMSLIVLFTLIVLVIYIKNMQTRMKTDWNKYYFASMETDNNQGSCSAPALK